MPSPRVWPASLLPRPSPPARIDLACNTALESMETLPAPLQWLPGPPPVTPNNLAHDAALEPVETLPLSLDPPQFDFELPTPGFWADLGEYAMPDPADEKMRQVRQQSLSNLTPPVLASPPWSRCIWRCLPDRTRAWCTSAVGRCPTAVLILQFVHMPGGGCLGQGGWLAVPSGHPRSWGCAVRVAQAGRPASGSDSGDHF